MGIAHALGRTTYPASAVAAVDCIVLAWPGSLWPEMSANFPSFGAGTCKTTQRAFISLGRSFVDSGQDRLRGAYNQHCLMPCQ